MPSYYDLSSENSYHMLILGMCLCYSSQYDVISNREAGKGRNDIILKAKNKKSTSFVLELKNLQVELKQLAHQAIRQIEDKKYSCALDGKVVFVALSHHGKDVEMEWKVKK